MLLDALRPIAKAESKWHSVLKAFSSKGSMKARKPGRLLSRIYWFSTRPSLVDLISRDSYNSLDLSTDRGNVPTLISPGSAWFSTFLKLINPSSIFLANIRIAPIRV